MKIFSMFLIIFFVSGCTSVGTKVDPNSVKAIKKGVTTESQVVAKFGEPNQVTTTGNRKTFYYSYRNDNTVGKSAAVGAAGVAAGAVLGPLGYIAGTLAGGHAVDGRMENQMLMVTIDTKTKKVVDYQYTTSKTQSGKLGVTTGVSSPN